QREELRRDLLAQQQVAQEQMWNIQAGLAQGYYAHQQQLQVLADQQRQHQAIELLHRQREAEAEHEWQELERLHSQREAEAEHERQELERVHRQREAEAEHERLELERLRRQQELEQEMAIEQQREREQQHLDELYQEYGPLSGEHHAED